MIARKGSVRFALQQLARLQPVGPNSDFRPFNPSWKYCRARHYRNLLGTVVLLREIADMLEKALNRNKGGFAVKIKVSGSASLLRIDVQRGNDTYGVDVAKPNEGKALYYALDVLMGMLAGVSKADLYLAVARHFEEASNAKEA